MHTNRNAACAEQADPNRNPQFRRRWSVPIITGLAPAGVRAWHSDTAPPLQSPARRRAERAWTRLTGTAAP